MRWLEAPLVDWILLSLAAILLLVLLLPLSRRKEWWIRGWEFPRLQLAVLSFLLAVVGLLALKPSEWMDWTPVIISVGCLVYHGIRIVPFTQLYPAEVRRTDRSLPNRTLSLLVSNVQMQNRETNRLLELVRQQQPDIVLALETNQRWEESLSPLRMDFPHIVACPLENTFGMHLYSRLPLKGTEVRYLVENDVPSIHTNIELSGGDRVRLYCVHPSPPSPTENETSEERDTELTIIGHKAAGSDGPVIVAGDLNDVAWSRTTRRFRRISGLLDPRIGRGLFNTFHARIPFFRWPLDHVFHCKCFHLRQIRRMPGIGSDHFPLYIELALHNDEAVEVEANGTARTARKVRPASRPLRVKKAKKGARV